MSRAATLVCVAALVSACSGPQEAPARQPTTAEVVPPPPSPPPPPLPAPDGAADAGGPLADDAGVVSVGIEDDGSAMPDRHCLLLSLRNPSEETALEVEQLLVREGLQVAREGPDVALLLTEAEIRRVFGARLRWSVTGASATPTMIREAHLQGGRVPARLRSRVASFAIGHQICE